VADQELGGKQRQAVSVVVRHGIELETLNRVVATVVGQTGCRTCGLGGVDLRIIAGDPGPEIEGAAAVITGPTL
jgi:hypothetical protein